METEWSLLKICIAFGSVNFCCWSWYKSWINKVHYSYEIIEFPD